VQNRTFDLSTLLPERCEAVINNKAVSYDFARQRQGVKKVKGSEFGDEIIRHLGSCCPAIRASRQ
jgi:isocitrate dehydrogenase